MSPKKASETAEELVTAALGGKPAKASAKPREKATPEKAAEARKNIRIRQIRSGIGCPVEMRETLKALGLGKMHRVAERRDTKEVRGMIAKIPHLVEVVD
jgi:large subunit ribosomal protein L30